MLGFALTRSSPAGWGDFCQLASLRLSTVERAQLAFVALASLDKDDAVMAAAAALGAVGEVSPAFLGGMADARSWASLASREELRCHALAAFEAMPPGDQAAFFRQISDIEVAA